MDAVLHALRDQCEVLGTLVAGLHGADWDRPSACDGWTVADVLLHLAQTNELTVASVTGDLAGTAGRMGWLGPAGAAIADVDTAADAAVSAQRGAASGDEVLARWQRSVVDMLAGLAGCARGQRVPWVVGDMAAPTLATTRLAETWLHTGDIAAGLGIEQPATDRIWHIARLAHRTLPYAFARAGRELHSEVAFELTSPLDQFEVWRFGADDAATVVAGPALDLCLVAGQRASAAGTALSATGPDAETVLAVVRTFA